MHAPLGPAWKMSDRLNSFLAHFSTERLFLAVQCNTKRPNSLPVAAAEGLGLCTSRGDAEVTLRMGDSGLAAETPLTVNQMFVSAVERFGDYTALSWKEGEQQKSLSYREYYKSCRTAAKSFLKVVVLSTYNFHPPFSGARK